MTHHQKKILIVNKYFDHIGGVEEVVRQLATIDDPSVAITILALGDPTMTAKLSERFPNARLIILPISFTAMSMPVSWRFFRVFLQELKKAEIVHLHSPFPLAEWYLATLNIFTKFSCKIVITWHADIINQKLFIGIHHWFLRRLFKISNRIVTTSPAITERSKILQPYLSKIEVIPLGVRGAETVSHDSLASNSALFVGRLTYYKGITYLIDALKGTDIQLTIVGSGALEKALKAQSEKNNVASQIVWKGAVSDEALALLYKNAGMFVFPSIAITEALGLVQAEAMSYGLPIINTDLPTGVPWVAREGQEAITVPIKDVEALRSALVRLSNHADLRSQLGKNGRERYEKLFTSMGMKNNYLKLYKSLVSE